MIDRSIILREIPGSTKICDIANDSSWERRSSRGQPQLAPQPSPLGSTRYYCPSTAVSTLGPASDIHTQRSSPAGITAIGISQVCCCAHLTSIPLFQSFSLDLGSCISPYPYGPECCEGSVLRMVCPWVRYDHTGDRPARSSPQHDTQQSQTS